MLIAGIGGLHKKSKYRNKPTVVDGIKFASKKEAKRYAELLLLRRAGVITDLKLQPRFPIEIGGIIVRYVSQRGAKGVQVVYVADFQYRCMETGRTITEDVKGYRTDVFKIKKALVAAMGIEIIEV